MFGNSTLSCWASVQMFPLSVVVFPQHPEVSPTQLVGSIHMRYWICINNFFLFLFFLRKNTGGSDKQFQCSLNLPSSPTLYGKLQSLLRLVVSWHFRGTFTVLSCRKFNYTYRGISKVGQRSPWLHASSASACWITGKQLCQNTLVTNKSTDYLWRWMSEYRTGMGVWSLQ